MPFSQETPLVQQFQINYVDRRWQQLNTLVKEWTDKAVNFLLLTNSGGAVAVLSFIGTSRELQADTSVRFALLFFSLGIISTGVVIARQFHRVDNLHTNWRTESGRYFSDEIHKWNTLIEADNERAKPSGWWDYALGYAPFVLFILGCACGALSLFCTHTAVDFNELRKFNAKLF